MYIKQQVGGVEGEYFPYWKSRLGLAAPGEWNPATHPNILTAAINAQSAAQNVRLRSANINYSGYAWHIYSIGKVGYSDAASSFRFAPVCVIC